MASTNEVVQGWINSGGKATSPEQAISSSKSGDGELTPASQYEDTELRAENSTMEDLLPGSENDPTDSSNSESADSNAEQKTSEQVPNGTKEVITVTDEKGRRRKVEIDYSDRQAARKAYEMMHGARKWQSERDQALKSQAELRNQIQERDTRWQSLENAFQQGIEPLVDMLTGRKGAFQEHVQKQLQRSKFLEQASPEEVQALEARELADRQQKELATIRKENEEFRKGIEKERDEAQFRSLESRVHPVFEKYRFSDKLGDPTDEHMFDEMLWNSALKRLEPYEEKGLDITPELVEREFRTVAQTIRKRIGVQAEKRVSKAIDQKKQEATENVQAKIKSGYKTGGVAKEARDLINSGNLSGLLKDWKKYGGLFRK